MSRGAYHTTRQHHRHPRENELVDLTVIVCEQGEQLVLVTQTDHAKLAADTLQLWMELRDHSWRRLILWATTHHDDGWQEADAAPMVDPSGRPCDFLTLPAAERIRVWERGTARYLTSNPDGAGLILKHALNLLGDSTGEPWTEFLEMLRGRLGMLKQQALPAIPRVATNYRWLKMADHLSLIVCNRWQGAFEMIGPLGRVEGELSDHVLRLRPFPLAGSTRFEIPCRFIPGRTYRDAVDLATTLASARWKACSILIEPFS